MKTVIFDWDGTLIDSKAKLLDAWRAATQQVIGRAYPSTPEEERFVAARNGHNVLSSLTPSPDVQQQLTTAYHALYTASTNDVAPFPGIPELLVALRSSAHRIAVVTAKARARFEADVAHAGLADYIDVCICAEDVDRPKPDPAGVLHALDRLGATAAAATMVGDSPQDIAAGLAAGTRTVGVTWGFFGAADLAAAGAHALASTTDEFWALLTSSK